MVRAEMDSANVVVLFVGQHTAWLTVWQMDTIKS